MRLGVGLPTYASGTHTIPPDRFRRYARLADEFGFAGAWVIEHLGENPNYATSFLDPLTALSVVAGETETLPVGTSVLLLPLRNPVLTAKRAVTLQHVSSRQLTLGLGLGYVQSEFDAVGVPMDERSARYLEGIELVRRLFEEDTVTFDGEFYSVDELRLEPDPGRSPRILAGGSGVDTDDGRRVATGVKERLRFADGWIAPPRPTDLLESDWTAFADHLEANGRDPERVDKVALQYLHLSPSDDPDQVARTQRRMYDGLAGTAETVDEVMTKWLSGTVEDVRAALSEYERQGFDEVILHPTARNPDELERQLRLYREFLLPAYP